MGKDINEENWTLELNLNRITVVEELVHQDTFSEYKQMVIVLSQIKDWYLTEEEVLLSYEMQKIEDVFQQYPHVLKTNAHWKNADGTFDIKYIDIAIDYNVKPSDPYYDIFFTRKLRQLDLLEIDDFLDYHLINYYENNLQDFSRFLKISIRKHGANYIKPEFAQTVNEWIDAKEKEFLIQQQKETQQQLLGITDTQTNTKKTKIKREANDKLTCLNQEQTVLLMYYLQQERVLLKDEYLSDKEAGIAFEALTGYSQNTLRQNLSKFHLYQNKPNLKEIDNLLTRLKIAIDKDLKQK